MAEIWHRVLCFLTGHNLIGADLPRGWSRQPCTTCGLSVDAYRKEW